MASAVPVVPFISAACDERVASGLKWARAKIPAYRESQFDPDEQIHQDWACDALKQLLSQEPFAGKVERSHVRTLNHVPARYAIAIPVRDEQSRLPATFQALARSMFACEETGTLVFVVNNTADRSEQLIAELARDSALSVVIVSIDFATDIRDAPHARRMALDMSAAMVPNGILLSTDADTNVGRRWVETCFHALRSGSDLVCEDVDLNEAELARLPPSVRSIGDAERAYFEASEQLWQIWTGGTSERFAYRASGASLGITTQTYEAIGRLPLPFKGEDQALCAAVRERGYHVRQLTNVGTQTSARLDGRAVGGCGEALADRAINTNAWCDQALVPLRTLRERAWRHRSGEEHSADSQRDCDDASGSSMRYHDVVRELRKARMLLHGQA